MQEEKSSYLSAEWDHGGLGHDATAPLVLMGLLSGRDPPRKGAPQLGPYTNSSVKNQASKRKQEIALIVFAIPVLHLSNEAKSFVHNSPGWLLHQTHPAQASAVAVMNPTILHRWAEHQAGFQIASYSKLITRAGLALLFPSVNSSRTPILRLFCCSVITSPSRVHRKKCLHNENTAEQWECPSKGKLDSSPTCLPVNTGEGKDNLPGVMS